MPVPDFEFLINAASNQNEILQVKRRAWNCDDISAAKRDWIYYLLDEKLKLIKRKGG